MSVNSDRIKKAPKNSCAADIYKSYPSDVTVIPSEDKVKFVSLIE